MQKLLFLFFLCIISVGYAGGDTDVYSVYFDAKCKPKTDELTTIHKKFYAIYKLTERSETDLRTVAGNDLVVDESGMYISKNQLLSISREEIRENSSYSIRNGYLFGVVDNDSLMVALEGESYYFLIPKKIYLYKINSAENRLFQGLSKNEFLILMKENNGYFSALYIRFNNGASGRYEISLSELNFDQKELDFRTINNVQKVIDKIPTYILNPKKNEWESIMNQFMVYDRYRVE